MPASDPPVGPAAHGTIRPRHCQIGYTAAEWEAIVEAARASGRTPTAFVRNASLEALPIGHSAVGNAPLIRALGHCGTTLARLATTAREIGAMPEAASLELALVELLAVVRRIEQPLETSLRR